MNDIDNREIERRLREVPLAPAPGYLRTRALDAARRHRTARSWASPRQRIWLAACASALLVVLVADAFLSHAQRTRLFALSGSTRPAAPRPDDQNGILAEVIGKGVIPRPEAAALGSPEPRIRLAPSLSGDLENELLLEDSHDSSKSLH